MKCERCHQNEAVIHISQIINGQKTERHLCQSCANETGVDLKFQNMYNPLLSGGLFGGSIFNTTGGIPAFGGTSRDLVCPNCGTSFEIFRKSGLFGCSQCYETFRERLDPLLRRVQGSTRHIGRMVCKTEENKEQLILKARLTELRKKLAGAVEKEDYEEAVKLRDESRILDSRLCENGSGSDRAGSRTAGPQTGQDGQQNVDGGASA